MGTEGPVSDDTICFVERDRCHHVLNQSFQGVTSHHRSVFSILCTNEALALAIIRTVVILQCTQQLVGICV
jgi:hypothetical protein